MSFESTIKESFVRVKEDIVHIRATMLENHLEILKHQNHMLKVIKQLEGRLKD